MSASLGTHSANHAYSGACRRGYFRVSSRMPLRLTLLSKDEAEDLRHELSAPGEEATVVGDHLLEARLCRLEQKLDQLLLRAGVAVELPISKAEKRDVELSGSGLRVRTTAVYQVDDSVKLELTLPEENGRPIRVLARVVAPTRGRDGVARNEVAVVFQTIRERDREAIVRHAYEVQRLELGRASKRTSLR